jgi:Tfp pilus assembly PilM family ATPase
MSSPGFFQSAAPDVAVAIEAGHVAAARLTWRGSTATIAAHAVETLPPGMVWPSLAASNIADVTVVGRAVAQVVGQLGVTTRRAALVVPDTVAKVSLIKFENVPPKSADLVELMRWQIKKAAPFPLEQATLSFTPGIKPADGGQEFVVTVARTDVLAEYERACEHASLHAGLVDISTFSIINSVLGANVLPSGDWLLVHTTPTYTTLAVMRDRDLIFFRHRDEDAEVTLADVVHQTAMYYEDRLKGGGFARVLLAGGSVVPGGTEALRRNIEERLSVEVEPVDPRGGAALLDRISASPEMLDALAPLVGILLRERKAA